MVYSLKNYNRNTKGFTLIEILIVLMIVGITSSFALMSFGDFGAKRRIHLAIAHFVDTIEFAKIYARLSGETLGIAVEFNNYQVLKFTPPNQWVILADIRPFVKQYFPKDTLTNIKSKYKNPDIIINVSGDITPFVITIGTTKTPQLETITGKSDGTLLWVAHNE